MKRNLIKFGLTFICFLSLNTSALAQINLREALDFDDDDKADFSVFRPSNNYWYVLKSSNGNLLTKYFDGFLTTDYLTPGDFDGDDIADFAAWRDSDGTWYGTRSSNNTTYSVQFGQSGDEPVAGDYDGDDITDFAFVRRVPPASCQVPGYMYWFIKRSSDQSTVSVQFGYDTDYAIPGDYDGDGKFDYAVQRPQIIPSITPCASDRVANGSGSADFYILLSSNSNLQVGTYGSARSRVVTGDYDGDGKTDIAVVNEGITPTSNLIWEIWQSTAGYKVVSFGLTGSDKTAQADYDGDNKTDIAVWREDGGMFYWLKSSNNDQFLGTQFGSFGDLPAAGFTTH
ncbi:MAG: VCBS repeat-containing protein [Pyrinomonadaceae bacterium]